MSAKTSLPRLRVTHLLAMAGFYFCSGAFLMQFPRIVLGLGGSAQDVGWLLALGLVPVLCLAGVVGEWNRRRGGRWPLVVGGTLTVLSNVLMIWIDHVGLAMLALRMLYAVGHAMVFGTLFAQAAFLVEHPLQRARLICHIVLLLTMVLVPWMHTPHEAMLLGLAFGLSYGWLYPALSALAFDRVPEQGRGRVAGWLVAGFEVGFRLSPLGLGTLIIHAGYGGMFVGLALAYAAVLMISRGVTKKSVQLAPAGI